MVIGLNIPHLNCVICVLASLLPYLLVLQLPSSSELPCLICHVKHGDQAHSINLTNHHLHHMTHVSVALCILHSCCSILIDIRPIPSISSVGTFLMQLLCIGFSFILLSFGPPLIHRPVSCCFLIIHTSMTFKVHCFSRQYTLLWLHKCLICFEMLHIMYSLLVKTLLHLLSISHLLWISALRHWLTRSRPGSHSLDMTIW